MIKLDKLVELIEEFKNEKGLPPYFESEDLAQLIHDEIKKEEKASNTQKAQKVS